MEKGKSKKLVTIVLVIAAILGLAAIATAYYFYQIRDVTPQDSGATLTQGCGCYYVAATEKVQSCADADPKMAFEFKPGIIQNDVCTATCDTREASDLSLSVLDEELDVLSCNLSTFSANPGCLDVSIEDTDGKRVGDGLLPTDVVTLKATFNIPEILSNPDQDYYEGFYFLVNGERKDIDAESAEVSGGGTDREFTVSTQLSEYSGAETLTVQAFGSPITQGEITSEACLRELTLYNSLAPSCREISAEVTVEGTAAAKVSEVSIQTTGISEPESLSVKFTIGANDVELTTKDIADKFSSGEALLLLDQEFLYDSSNFTSSKNFSVLDSEATKMDIAATLIVDGETIDSDACTISEAIPSRELTAEEDTTTTDTTTDTTDTDTTDTTDTTTSDTDTDTTTSDTGDTSNFTVSKTASAQCREHEAPNNEILYTIVVTNTDTTYEDVASVKDKLPLGFSYVAGSTLINEVEVTDTDYVTVTEVGDTDEIVWQAENGWSVNTSDTLTIEFTALITDAALTGDNLNEVVVTPVNTPVDADTLRTEVTVEVAQSCTAPETAIFDTTISKIILGIMVLVFGAAFYYTNTGNNLTEKFIGSGAVLKVYRTVKLFGWKLTDPRKYFEEKTVDVIEKKKKRS